MELSLCWTVGIGGTDDSLKHYSNNTSIKQWKFLIFALWQWLNVITEIHSSAVIICFPLCYFKDCQSHDVWEEQITAAVYWCIIYCILANPFWSFFRFIPMLSAPFVSRLSSSGVPYHDFHRNFCSACSQFSSLKLFFTYLLTYSVLSAVYCWFVIPVCKRIHYYVAHITVIASCR